MNNSLRQITVQDILAKKPCSEAVRWIEAHPGLTVAELGYACEEPEWMLWVIRKLDLASKEQYVEIAVRLVRETPGVCGHLTDPRSRTAIETAEAWLRGEATIEQMDDAVDADAAAYYANAAADRRAAVTRALYAVAEVTADDAYIAAEAAVEAAADSAAYYAAAAVAAHTNAARALYVAYTARAALLTSSVSEAEAKRVQTAIIREVMFSVEGQSNEDDC